MPNPIIYQGNHTDYNEGFVLSAAIDKGTFFLLKKKLEPKITIFAKNVNEEITFEISSLIEVQKFIGNLKVSGNKKWSTCAF